MLKQLSEKIKKIFAKIKNFRILNKEIVLIGILSAAILTLGAIGIGMQKKSAKKNAIPKLAQEEPQEITKEEEQPVDKTQEKPLPESPSQKTVAAITESAPQQVPKNPAPKPTPATNKAPAIGSKQAPATSPATVKTDVETMQNLVNSARAAKGLQKLKVNSKLNEAALAKAKDMAQKRYFAHINPEGRNDFYFVTLADYRYARIGGNLANGNFKDTKAVFDAWMASPGHKANILASYGQEMGYAKYGNYYVLFIAKPA